MQAVVIILQVEVAAVSWLRVVCDSQRSRVLLEVAVDALGVVVAPTEIEDSTLMSDTHLLEPGEHPGPVVTRSEPKV